jgi:acyl carrier protein
VSDENGSRTAELLAAIAKAQRIPVERVTLDSTFEELGIDSLDGFSLLYDVEERFGIEIGDDDAREIRDVRSLLALVERLVSARESSPDEASAPRP